MDIFHVNIRRWANGLLGAKDTMMVLEVGMLLISSGVLFTATEKPLLVFMIPSGILVNALLNSGTEETLTNTLLQTLNRI